LGQWHFNKLTTEDHRKAIEHLNKAVELDRKFVRPYTELVAIHIWDQAGVFADTEERFRKTKELADKLLALDPMLAEGHIALAQCRFMQRDWRGAENEAVRAIKLNPRSSLARDLYVFLLSLQGRAEEAQPHAQRSQELNPTARTTALVACWPFFSARQFDLAIAQGKRVVELDKNFPMAHGFLGQCYEAQSNYLAAIEEYKTFDLLEGRDSIADYATLREAYNTLGQEGYLRKSIELIHRDAALPEGQRMFSEADLPGYYARLGENEKALDELEKSAEKGFQSKLLFEPMFDTLHDEPRFKALLKRAGLEK
jgi:tetratricopeptide (TPR) repeat protein